MSQGVRKSTRKILWSYAMACVLLIVPMFATLSVSFASNAASALSVDDASAIFAQELLSDLARRPHRIAVAEFRTENTDLIKADARHVIDGLERALIRQGRSVQVSVFPRQDFESIVDEIWRSGLYDERLERLTAAAKKAQVDVIVIGSAFEGVNAVRMSFKALDVTEGGRMISSTRERRVTLASASDGPPASQSQTKPQTIIAELVVRVSAAKNDGRPWDIDGGGPDVAICINSAEHNQLNKCHPPKSGVKMHPYCRNSYRCKFRRISLPLGDFQVVIFDVDFISNDMIGSGTCSVGMMCDLGNSSIIIKAVE